MADITKLNINGTDYNIKDEIVRGLVTTLQNEGYIKASDIIDVLTSTNANVPLSANQGRELNVTKIDNITISGNILRFTASGNTIGSIELPTLTTNQSTQLNTAYNHSQSTHAPSNAEANVQSDWNVTDTNSDAYIANKPTKVSAFTNDAKYVNETYVDNAIENISASNIPIQDTANNFTATNVEEALAELFQFVSNGKTLIASAITDMGIATSNTDSFEVMANNIRMISGGSGEITTHTITNNLTNCTTNNNNESVLSNSSYSAIITANNGYTNLSITVTMGEIDITSNVVRGNVINIPNVTGNISITARATQSSTEVVIDESLEILTSFNYINMTEGGYKVLYVKLSKQPTSNVVVNISSSSPNLSLSKSSLTFTNTNWYTSQSVNVISSSDTNTIDEMYQLTLSSSGLSDKIVTIDVTDESNSGFEVLYNNGELISGASLSLTNATDNGTYITTNMNADESIAISGYKLNLNKNDKVHLLVGLATTDPASAYSIRSMQLGDNSANDISGSNMISEEAISKNLVNGKVDTYWTVASSLSNIELTFTGYFARVNIYKIYIERGN